MKVLLILSSIWLLLLYVDAKTSQFKLLSPANTLLAAKSSAESKTPEVSKSLEPSKIVESSNLSQVLESKQTLQTIKSEPTNQEAISLSPQQSQQSQIKSDSVKSNNAKSIVKTKSSFKQQQNHLKLGNLSARHASSEGTDGSRTITVGFPPTGIFPPGNNRPIHPNTGNLYPNPISGNIASANDIYDFTSYPYQVECLHAHNLKRTLHRSPPLEVNPRLIDAARDVAIRAARVGRPIRHTNLGLGVNQGVSTSRLDCDDSVRNWYDQSLFYDYNRPGYSERTGAFTQLVWANSRSLACAQVQSRISQQFHIACVYSPYGNIINRFHENVLPPVGTNLPLPPIRPNPNPYPQPQPGPWNTGRPTPPIYPPPVQPNPWNENRPYPNPYPQPPLRPGYNPLPGTNPNPGYDNIGPYSSDALNATYEATPPLSSSIDSSPSSASSSVSSPIAPAIERSESADVPVNSHVAESGIISVEPDILPDGSYAVPPARPASSESSEATASGDSARH